MPPRKTDQAKRLQGTFRPDRAAPAPLAMPLEPQPSRAPAGFPNHLAGEWANLASVLHTAGLLTAADAPLLEMAVLALDAARAAAEAIRADGTTLEDPKHRTVKRNPAVAAFKDATASYLALARELGLTPLARTKLAGAAPKKPANPWEALDDGR